MTEENTSQPELATIEALELICTGATPAFILGQIKAQATLESAIEAFIDQQSQRITELEARVADEAEDRAKMPGNNRKKASIRAEDHHELGEISRICEDRSEVQNAEMHRHEGTTDHRRRV